MEVEEKLRRRAGSIDEATGRYSVDPFASAITYTLIRLERPNLAPSEIAQRANRVARFVTEQRERTPDYLRPPIRWLSTLLDWSTAARFGKRFHLLPHAQRCEVIAGWRGSRFGFQRDLIRFYETLVLFGWHADSTNGCS
jgi:hypothetical protein